MKVYVATSGEYSGRFNAYVFTKREDAEAYAGPDNVEEHELREGPVERRPRHVLTWNPALPDRDADPGLRELVNPHEWERLEDFDGRAQNVTYAWIPPSHFVPAVSDLLQVEGWDLERVRKVYTEQRAQYQARRELNAMRAQYADRHGTSITGMGEEF